MYDSSHYWILQPDWTSVTEPRTGFRGQNPESAAVRTSFWLAQNLVPAAESGL